VGDMHIPDILDMMKVDTVKEDIHPLELDRDKDMVEVEVD